MTSAGGGSSDLASVAGGYRVLASVVRGCFHSKEILKHGCCSKMILRPASAVGES